MSIYRRVELYLTSKQELTYALLRVVSGLMFSAHGVQKLFGALTERPPAAVWSQAWFGGVIELAAGVAIACGVFTSLAALLASGTMAVAYTQFHWKLQWGEAFFPIVNKGELAVVYCFLFLFIACAGTGAHGLQRRRR